MNIQPVDAQRSLGSQLSVSHTARKDAGRRPSNLDVFAGMVGKQQTDAKATSEDKARTVAEQYVAGALVLPLLKQAREARDASPPFGMTDAEKKLGSLMDNRIANDMVRRGNWALVDRIASQLQHAGKPQPQPAPADAAPQAATSLISGINL
jgi:hypothetical protein